MSVSLSGVPWWRSLRLPIAVVVAMSAVISALLIGYVADRSATSAGLHRLRAETESQLKAADATYEFTGDAVNGAILAEDVTEPAGVPLAVIQSALRAKGRSDVTYFNGTEMWAARAVAPGGVLAVRTSADSLARERDHLHQSFFAVGIAVLVLAFLGGWLVAGPITGRLRSAARWVEVGAFERASGDVAYKWRDEVGELVHAIERLSATLRDRVRTEAAFTADVAHELRTPMTALVSAASLLPEANEPAQLVRRQVGRLRILVDELLELARADNPDATVSVEPVAPESVVESVSRQFPDLGPFSVSVEAPAAVVAERWRLERVVINLLANAQRHGAAPISVTVSGRDVIVRDAGPGFPDELLATGPQRLRGIGRTAGSGLGLAIAEAYCKQIGATLTLSNANGAVATVRLAAAD